MTDETPMTRQTPRTGPRTHARPEPTAELRAQMRDGIEAAKTHRKDQR